VFNGLVCENACANAFLCLIMQSPGVHGQIDTTTCSWLQCTHLEKIQILCAEFKPYFLKVWSLAAEHILAIHYISAFILDVDDLDVRGHGAILEPGVYSD